RPDDPDLLLLAAQTARRLGDDYDAMVQLDLCAKKNGPAAAIALEHQLLRVQQGDRQELDALLCSLSNNPTACEAPLILEECVEASLHLLMTQSAAGPTPETTPELERTRQAIEQWLKRCPGAPDQAQGFVWRGRLHSLRMDYKA